MKITTLILSLTASMVFAQQPAPTPPPPLVKENATVKISEHVHVIPDGNVGGVPNVGIIVGNNATLVVDTGLGVRNGQTVLREATKIRPANQLYVVATHFHAEHTLGEAAFPATAKVIRARALQADMDQLGIAPNFSGRSPVHTELVQNAAHRRADEIFDNEKVLDLGGVRARLVWMGPGTHTNGDTIVFVEGDAVLFAGDLVMNRRFLAFGANQSASVRAWLASHDKLEPLRPRHIIPAHGDMGDGSLIETNRRYLRELQARVAALKREGKSLEETTQTIATEFQTRYTGWTGNAGQAVRSAYNEAN
jgi:glyoxylase-like metal-dependent hydrolase (beta-lactamase superfamily II)